MDIIITALQGAQRPVSVGPAWTLAEAECLHIRQAAFPT